MTTRIPTTNRPTLNDTLANIKEDHYLDTKGEVLRIDVTRTLANIFGVHDDESVIEQLCDLSDLAANVRSNLEDEDLDTVVFDLSINERTFISDFIEWAR